MSGKYRELIDISMDIRSINDLARGVDVIDIGERIGYTCDCRQIFPSTWSALPCLCIDHIDARHAGGKCKCPCINSITVSIEYSRSLPS